MKPLDTIEVLALIKSQMKDRIYPDADRLAELADELKLARERDRRAPKMVA